MVMAVASGYPDYSGSLIKPHLKDRIIDRFYCSSMFTEITNGDFLGDLKQCGDTIQWRRKPRAVIHTYIKNQKLEHDYLEHDCVAVKAGKGVYFNLKLDNVDKHQICNSRELVDYYTEDAHQQIKLAMEMDVLAEMIMGVDVANQGCCAGCQTRCYNLGDFGKPRCINCDNVLDWFCDIYSVLMESCVVTPGHGWMVSDAAEPFIVLPIQGYNTLKKALSKINNCAGYETQPLVNGRIPERIGNFHIYIAHNLPYYIENDEMVYQVPAGRRDATGFVTTIEDMREIEHPDYWGCLFQGLVVWAAATLYPEALTLSRVKFEKEAA